MRWEWPEQPLGADHTAGAHRQSLHNAGSMVSTRWSQLAGMTLARKIAPAAGRGEAFAGAFSKLFRRAGGCSGTKQP